MTQIPSRVWALVAAVCATGLLHQELCMLDAVMVAAQAPSRTTEHMWQVTRRVAVGPSLCIEAATASARCTCRTALRVFTLAWPVWPHKTATSVLAKASPQWVFLFLTLSILSPQEGGFMITG